MTHSRLDEILNRIEGKLDRAIIDLRYIGVVDLRKTKIERDTWYKKLIKILRG